jgi:hypothetical protein
VKPGDRHVTDIIAQVQMKIRNGISVPKSVRFSWEPHFVKYCTVTPSICHRVVPTAELWPHVHGQGQICPASMTKDVSWARVRLDFGNTAT